MAEYEPKIDPAMHLFLSGQRERIFEPLEQTICRNAVNAFHRNAYLSVKALENREWIKAFRYWLKMERAWKQLRKYGWKLAIKRLDESF